MERNSGVPGTPEFSETLAGRRTRAEPGPWPRLSCGPNGRQLAPSETASRQARVTPPLAACLQASSRVRFFPRPSTGLARGAVENAIKRLFLRVFLAFSGDYRVYFSGNPGSGRWEPALSRLRNNSNARARLISAGGGNEMTNL